MQCQDCGEFFSWKPVVVGGQEFCSPDCEAHYADMVDAWEEQRDNQRDYDGGGFLYAL